MLMSDLRFPTTVSEHDVYFIQFSFYEVTPLLIRDEEGNFDEGQIEDIGATVQSVFNYDTRVEDLKDIITLPIKSTINEETSGNFDESSMRKLSSIAQALSAEGDMSDLVTSFVKTSKVMPEELRRGIDLATQTAINERMQVFYTGPNRRGYTFEFPLAAKNIKDARVMRKIARKFQFHSSPSLGNSGTTWNYPNITSFKFMRHVYTQANQSPGNPSETQGQPVLEDIDTLFKSKKCYIENVTVQYGDDRFVQFTDGADYETGIMTLSITLKEIDYFVQDDFADDGEA